MINNFGFVRVSAVAPQLKVADVEYNVQEIKEQFKSATKKGSQIVLFPELGLTGYTCADLFFQDILLEKALIGLENLLEYTKNFSSVLIVGLPIKLDNQLFNVAVAMQKGKLLGIVPKTYIPNYGEFYEKRWFASGKNAISKEILLFGQKVPFGLDLLFENSINTFAIEVCEDFWAPYPPSTKYCINGANIIFNLSASNEVVGKYDYRKSLVNGQSSRCFCGYVYASAGAGESTSDVVFSGHIIISENGSILNEGERFSFESKAITSDIDVAKLNNLRSKNISFMGAFEKDEMRRISYSLEDSNTNLLREYEKYPFVPNDTEKRNVRCEEIFKIQSTGLAKRLNHIGTSKSVIGISGGLDSTLAFLVMLETIKKLNKPVIDIIAISMPGFGTSDRTKDNAKKLVEAFGATFLEIDIKEACSKHLKDINHSGVHDVTYENVQARERTQILMDIANKENGIVIGTGDLSEQLLGWSTYNGDHMSMYSVNNSIPKTLVQYLVRWVADNMESNNKQILYDILDTPISPELLPTDGSGAIAQKTEQIVGPYILHDFFAYHMLRYGATPKKIFFIAKNTFKEDFSDNEILHWLKFFIKRFFTNQFKRNCVPDGPKVGTVSVSPRGDWRMPSDAEYKLWLDDLENLDKE